MFSADTAFSPYLPLHTKLLPYLILAIYRQRSTLRSFWSQRRAEIILDTKPVAKLPIWRPVPEGHVSNKLLCSYYLHEVLD